MKRVHYVLFASIVVIGLAAGILLLPSEPELALIRYRDKEFDGALAAYERRLASNELSVSVVSPLCKLYLEYGNIEQAIALMERYVRNNGADVEARLQLARYYQYAHRLDDYQQAIEAAARMRPTEPILRELANLYSFNTQFERQIETLHELVARHPVKPDDFLDLARLEAAEGRLAGAAETLRRFESLHPKATNSDTVELLLAVLLDSGQGKAASERATAWLEKHPDPYVAARYADVLQFKRQPREALQVLAPFERHAETVPLVLTTLTRVEVANGLDPKALERLTRLYEAGRLAEEAEEPFLELLLRRGKRDLALEAARRVHLASIESWLLTDLAQAALAAGRQDFAAWMIRTLGEGFLQDQPVLGAELALARSDQYGARRWIARAESHPDLPFEQKTALARLYVRVGRTADARQLLQRFAFDPRMDDPDLGDLARLYVEAGLSREGLQVFDALLGRRRSPEVEAAWALLASGAGREADVLGWLRGRRESPVDEPLLLDIYNIAHDARRTALALEAAERLYRRRQGRPEALRLAAALVAARRPADALSHLRGLEPAGEEEESLYLEALRGALAAGERVREELERFWSRKLAEPALTEARREEIAFALLELGAFATALPAVEQLARTRGDAWLSAFAEAAVKAGQKGRLARFLEAELERRDLSAEDRAARLHLLVEHGGDAPALPHLARMAATAGGAWVSAYEEALGRLGRKGELVDFLKSRAARGDLPAAERRGLGFRLLDEGQKQAAEQVFFRLAERAAADSPDVSELLHLWGPRPRSAALDWLQGRALAAAGDERARWLEHLLDAGAPRRVVAVVARAPYRAGQGGRIADVYLQALAAERDGAALAAAIDRELPAARDAKTLGRYAQLALDLGQSKTAARAWRKVLEVAPADREALRHLGGIAYAAGSYAEARGYLARLLESGAPDYESRYQYAEILARAGDPAGRRHFERALEEIERAGSSGIAARLVRAQILHRLGRTELALQELERLLAENPADRNVRAEYAALLIAAGRFDDAERVLSRR